MYRIFTQRNWRVKLDTVDHYHSKPTEICNIMYETNMQDRTYVV
jgi:hypothetical protein